jgi:hypothetical protein
MERTEWKGTQLIRRRTKIKYISEVRYNKEKKREKYDQHVGKEGAGN